MLERFKGPRSTTDKHSEVISPFKNVYVLVVARMLPVIDSPSESIAVHLVTAATEKAALRYRLRVSDRFPQNAIQYLHVGTLPDQRRTYQFPLFQDPLGARVQSVKDVLMIRDFHVYYSSGVPSMRLRSLANFVQRR